MLISHSLSRREIRAQLRQYRRDLSASAQTNAALDIARQLSQIEALKHRQRIASYLANDGEIDLSQFHQERWQAGQHIYLPVLHPFAKQHLVMLHYHANTAMTENHFGIKEPKLDVCAVCPLANLDVILLPLVGFDSKGNRLGMGGGFYDRSLAPFRNQQTRPLLIGVAHDCQQVDSLPIESWDIPLDGIVTPSQRIMF